VNGTVFSLHEVPGERLQQRDDRMFRVLLAVPQPRLYSTSESWPENTLPPLYLKTGDGEYVEVELRQPAADGAAGEAESEGR
jgi:hypothetical protein